MIQGYDSIVVRMISKLLVPVIQLFALYVFFHGHYSPGGGFQAGILIGASIILNLLVGKQEAYHRTMINYDFPIACLGLTIYAGIGAVALLFKGPILDYAAIAFIGSENVIRRYYGILIAEAGVMLVVAMTLIVIFHVLALQDDGTAAS